MIESIEELEWQTLQKRINEIGGLSEPELGDIECAYRIVQSAHREQKRASGEPYITHLTATANILLDAGITNPSLIVAALLHDIVEDTDHLTQPDGTSRGMSAWGKLAVAFNDDYYIPSVVDNMTAPDNVALEITKEQAEEMYHDNLRNAGPDTLLVKMADRLHNLRTLSAMPKVKQRRKIQETLEVYFPIFELVLDEYPEEGSYLFAEMRTAISEATHSVSMREVQPSLVPL